MPEGQANIILSNQVRLLIMYSSELVCGVSSGVIRGATGQMSELVGG